MLVLFLIISVSKSNLFLAEFLFKLTKINLLRSISLRLLKCSSGQVLLLHGRDENLFRLIFETQIHIQIHIRYFKSLPIATYYLTTIHIKNLSLHSKAYNMDLKMKFISDVTFLLWVGISVNHNFRQCQSYRKNDKFNCCLEIQSRTDARISICTPNSLMLPSNHIHI